MNLSVFCLSYILADSQQLKVRIVFNVYCLHGTKLDLRKNAVILQNCTYTALNLLLKHMPPATYRQRICHKEEIIKSVNASRQPKKPIDKFTLHFYQNRASNVLLNCNNTNNHYTMHTEHSCIELTNTPNHIKYIKKLK